MKIDLDKLIAKTAKKIASDIESGSSEFSQIFAKHYRPKKIRGKGFNVRTKKHRAELVRLTEEDAPAHFALYASKSKKTFRVRYVAMRFNEEPDQQARMVGGLKLLQKHVGELIEAYEVGSKSGIDT